MIFLNSNYLLFNKIIVILRLKGVKLKTKISTIVDWLSRAVLTAWSN